ncbi:MAG TPA: GH92 family glycosyl hydrolase [Pyrinomonadaceae bacterium]|nr:GH92 family glycosyl hydrolase [Pyrinomonadaceae bacterium]
MKILLALLILWFLPLQGPPGGPQRGPNHYVDPFIGTAGHGHTFPGATVPFGMVQLSPDTRLTGWDGCSGYHYSDDVIYGFSHTHLSGTGISDYGDILLMPTGRDVYLNAKNGEQTDKGYASRFTHRNERAEPGYYSVKLEDDQILAELTTTKRVGVHRYTYPNTQDANIIIDLAHRDKVIDSKLIVTGDRTIEGWRRSEAWAKNQIVYFALEFARPFTSYGLAADDQIIPGLKEAKGTNVKAFFRFDVHTNQHVLAKVALSTVSETGARKNLAAETPDWDFERIRAAASTSWQRELNKVEVKGGTEAQLRNFYTALYHSMTAPNLFMDVDGQYLGRDFKIHQANGFENYTVFSLWDTFRAAHPLYTIIDQKRTSDFIRTFLAQYEQGGRLPVWELAANETDTMIGYHAVSVIADALAKGIGGFDSEQAFKAVKHSADLKHFGLDAYTDHGYIGMEEERESVSKTLEYAYDDWCIAQVARLLGKDADYTRFIQRAQSYKNVFDPESGFMRPRSNGNWLDPFDPREVDFNFTEANSWQYTFFVPHDVSGLIDAMGGKQRFAEKLDQLFTGDSRTTGREQADITGLIGQYAHGNEPSHHMAYLYNYANQPWKTQFRVRQILDEFYKPEPDGLIGNEDCGQMSAWYVLSAAGFYPVTPGSTIYAIGTPLFPEVRFNLENQKTFVIKAQGVSKTNLYIESATLNGKPYHKSYLTHQDLMAGGELVFKMSAQPNLRWGTGDNDAPISKVSEQGFIPVPVIKAAGQTFRDRLDINIKGNAPASGLGTGTGARTRSSIANIYYTVDGSQPSKNSLRFTQPFSIDRSSTVKAIVIEASGSRSLVATGNFLKIPHNWNLTLTSKYSAQYPGGGDLALIDGIRGTTNWSGGAWQGYQGQDLVAVVDLGKTETVARLGAGFLQDIGSWIWLPRQVDFDLSTDGRSFVQALTVRNDVPENKYGIVMKDLAENIRPQEARYIRIRARNYGQIPAWHAGAGGEAWIFVDEIIIK